MVIVVATTLAVPARTQAQCTVCESCVDDYDCGLDEFCAEFTSGARCTAYCDYYPCPGDAECYQVPVDVGGFVYLCLNPGAEVSFCDAAYSCGGGTNPVDPCEGVTCPGGGICSPATGTCIGGSEDTAVAPDTTPPPDTSPEDTAPAADTGTPDVVATLDTGVSPPADTQSKLDTALADDGRIAATGDGCACALRAHRSGSSTQPLLFVALLAGMSLVWRRRR
jgi:hypothetical protein